MENKQRQVIEKAIDTCQSFVNGTQHLPFDAPNSLREALDEARLAQQNDAGFQQARQAYEQRSRVARTRADLARQAWERGRRALENEELAVAEAFQQHPTGIALAAAEKAHKQATAEHELLRQMRKEAERRLPTADMVSLLPVMAIVTRALPGDPKQWPAALFLAHQYDQKTPFKALRGWWATLTRSEAVRQGTRAGVGLLDVHTQQETNRQQVQDTAAAREQAQIAAEQHRLSPEGRALLDALDTKTRDWAGQSQALGQEMQVHNTEASTALREWEAALQAQWQTPAFAGLLQAWLVHQQPKTKPSARNTSTSTKRSYQSSTLASQGGDDWLLGLAVMANVMDASGCPTPGGGMDWGGGGGMSGGGGASGGWDAPASSPSPSPSYDSDYSSSSSSGSSSYSMD